MSASLWAAVLERIRSQVNSYSFNTWFKPTQFVSAGGKALTVQVPNPLFAEWLRKNYLLLINQTVQDIQGEPCEIVFLSAGGPPPPEIPVVLPAPPPGNGTPAATHAGSHSAGPRRTAFDPPPGSAPQLPAASSKGPAPREARAAGLNARYTFESFVQGSGNQFAAAAATAVAERPSRSYNPLYIYGFTGLGKTHLMQAIGNQLAASDPSLRIQYTTSEAFMNEMITAIRYEQMIAFKEKYRNVDVLLVDDIQFLTGKERTQEEFFHTFNALYDAGKQIVLTSDCAPRDIASLKERLQSRFEWGLIADIQPPDLETKIAILAKKAENEGVSLPSDVALFIASSIKSNVRELEGALIRVMAYSSVRRQEISVELARSVLQDVVAAESPAVSIETIQKRVSEQFDLSVAELKSKSNTKAISYPRQIAMFLCKQLTRHSLPEIGKRFGGKHHTTVMHAIRKIESARKEDRELDRLLNQLMQAFE